MRIDRLRLLAFGPFTDLEIDLSEGREGLHIVFGRNEAGKSSSLRGLSSLLYGFPSRTRDSFIHPYERLRVGGLVRNSNGDKLDFIRRKGAKNTLRMADDETPIADSALAGFLGGVDQDVFLTMFGIGHAALIAGGQAITAGSGNVGELLFAAGAGLVQLYRLQGELRTEIDDLFKSAAKNPTINRTIGEYRKSRDALKNSLLSVEQWKKHDSALRVAENRLKALDEELRSKQSERNRLSRIEQTLPTMGLWKTAKKNFGPYADAIVLPGDFSKKRSQAQASLVAALQQAQESAGKLEQLSASLQGLAVPESLLAEADAIEGLRDRLGSYRKAMQDRPHLVTTQQIAEDSAKEILRNLGRPPDLSKCEALRLPRAKIVRIQNLGNQHAGYVTALEVALEECSKFRRDIATKVAAFEAAAIAANPGALRSAIRRAQEPGNLEQQLADTQERIADLEEQADIVISQLPRWSGTLEEVERLAIPDEETIDRIDDELGLSATRSISLEQQQTEVSAALQGILERLTQLEHTGDVPTQADLIRARQQRQRGWRLVLANQDADTGSSSEAAAFVEEFAPATSLSDAYQRSVDAADAIADRLRLDATLVATKVKLLDDQTASSARLARIEAQIVAATVEHSGRMAEWKSIWAPLKIVPATPKEMRAWRRGQQVVVGTIAELRAARLKAKACRQQTDVAIHELGKALAQAGDEDAAPDETLAALIDRSQQHAEASQTALNARATLQTNLKATQLELTNSEQRSRTAQQKLDAWQVEWAAFMADVHLRNEATTAEANSVLDDLNRLFQLLDESHQVGLRLAGIDQDAQQFTADVRAILANNAPEGASKGVEAAVTDLSMRLTAARKSQTQQELLQQQCGEQEQIQEKANRAIVAAETALLRLCQDAGCESVALLEEAERRSTARIEIAATIRYLEEILISQGGGKTLDDFISEAEHESPDSLRPRIDALKDETDRLNEERNQALQVVGGEKGELARMTDSDEAAAKAEDCESIAASLQAHVQRLALLRVASAVLGESIDIYRKQNQGPVLERASRMFADLTLGSFTELRTEVGEDDQPILLGRRASGDTVRIDGMSDGTSDPLYLALRLASLENWFATHESIPFIVDDVLLNFDDERSAAALRCLGELSQKTQVILFTHHQHIVEIAKRELPSDVLYSHVI